MHLKNNLKNKTHSLINKYSTFNVICLGPIKDLTDEICLMINFKITPAHFMFIATLIFILDCVS